MGIDAKYGKVTTEHGNIPDDEPVFLFRAQDLLALPAIALYAALVEQSGRQTQFAYGVKDSVKQFALWQGANHERTKLPD